MATIQVQGIYKKDGNGIFQPLRGNYVKDANGIFQQFNPGSGIKATDGNWYVLNELIKHIRDQKDGQLYPVKPMPDGNWWMTTNYAFAGNGIVYNNDETHRPYYGGLYDYNTAMANVWNGVALPSNTQWQALIDGVGGNAIAGKMLKSALNTRDNGANSPTNPTWTYVNDSSLGIDQYGFGIIPAGIYSLNGYLSRGFGSRLWTSNSGYYYNVTTGVNIGMGTTGISDCHSVRYIVTDTSILI